MAPKKSQPQRTPSPSSSYTSSSEDEPENQVKHSQISKKGPTVALTAPQSSPPNRPQSSEEDTDYSSDDSESTTQGSLDDEKQPSQKRPSQLETSSGKKAREELSSSESESESDEDEDSLPPVPPEIRTPEPSVKLTGNPKKQQDDKKRKVPQAASPSKTKGENNDKKRKVPEAASPAKTKGENNDKKRKVPEAASPAKTKGENSDKKRKVPEAASPAKTKGENSDKKRKLPDTAPPSASKEENGDTSKKLFERVWSPEDELALLELLASRKKHGHKLGNYFETNSLYNTVKMTFRPDITRDQLINKLQGFKRKYLRYWSKENGQLPKKFLADGNAQAAFELAKEIWGDGKESKSTEIEDAKLDLETNEPFENGDKSSKFNRPKAGAAATSEKSKDAVAATTSGKPKDTVVVTDSGKSKDDGGNGGPLSLNELVSYPVGGGVESPIIDFVANEFNCMGRDSLKKCFALLGSAEHETIENIWNHLKLKEMNFQIHRLEAAKEIIKVVRGVIPSDS